MHIVRGLLCFLLLCGVAANGPAEERFPHPAPLAYRQQHPIYLQSIGLVPMAARALPHGSGELAARLEYSNIFEWFINDREVRIDVELARYAPTIAYGLGHGFTLEADLPFVTSWGGAMDAFLQWWHRVLGVANSGREFIPNDEYHFYIHHLPTNTRLLEIPAQSFALGDLGVRLRHEVLTETARRPSLGWFVATEFPTGSLARGTGNGQLDFGFGVLTEKMLGRWHGFLNAGYFVAGRVPALHDFMRDEQFNYAVGIDFTVVPEFVIHTQLQGGTPLLHGLSNSRWDSFPLDLLIGLSGERPLPRAGQRLFWQAALSEDVHPNGPSIDVTLYAKVGWRWGGR